MASFADRNGGWWRNELPRVTASIQLSQDLCCDCGICWGSWETRRRYDGIASSVVATTQSEGQMCTSVWFKVSQVVPVGSGWAFITAWAHQLPQEGLGWVDIWSRGQYS